MKHQKYFPAIIIFVRIALILGLVGVPSSGWGQEKTIGNDVQTPQIATDFIQQRLDNFEFGWSITVPTGWERETLFSNPSSLNEFVIRQKVALYGPNRAVIWIDSYDNSSKLPIDIWFRERRIPLLPSASREIVFQRTTLGGLPAILAIDTKTHAVPSQIVIGSVQDEHAIAISYIAVDGGNARKTFMELANSFVWHSNTTQPANSAMPSVQIRLNLNGEFKNIDEPAAPIGDIFSNLSMLATDSDVYGYSTDTCCGQQSSRSICWCCFRKSLKDQPVGNCVWWACKKRTDVPCAADANKWPSCARAAGKTVNNIPAVGALAVRNTGNHIAYVESVNSDQTTIEISQMDCYSSRACGGNTGNDGVYRTSETASNWSYIHSGQSPQCSDNQAPVGGFSQPTNNQQVSDNVYLKGWARDDCNVDYVEFTATWPGQGWHVLKRIDTDCGAGQSCDYDYHWNLSGIPDGWVTIGYDIYDKTGKKVLSPNGTRQIRKVGRCTGPNLQSPSNGFRTKSTTITFRWQDVSCEHSGFKIRVKTNADMNSGGEIVAEQDLSGTETTINFDSNRINQALYWSVKANNAPGGAEWSPAREFRIYDEPPTIAFNTANGNSSGEINSRDQNWTFTGTAGDPEGRLNRVEFKCEGDSCNATQNIGTNGSWSFQRDGLTGRNRIWFTACDDRQCVDSRAVTLRIDLAPPVTTADANGQSNPSGWFRGPVEVKLRAQDGATGSASVGVREIRYRIDNGNWQNSSGDSKSLTINTDGAHTVEYYAVDHLDNQESPAKRIAFQIDASPPSAPGAATETHGVGNDQWQKSVGAPEFTWGAASDSTSGLQHYELYFGPDANSDQIQSFVAANADRRWTPLPNGVRTGVYYLRARARDLAGNYSAWSTLFTFRYDITPPGNPTAATHAANLPSGSWQRTSATADFIWTPPSDEGSGVKGYYIYWGDQPEGKDESTGAFRTSAAYGAAGPLCAASQSCTGYLRVRSVDYVDNFAGDWSTLFALRYDGAAPTLDFTINGGVTQTAQTLVSLNLNATDQGSGVRDARSFAGDNWSAWEPYQTERIETIPAIGRQSWPVYVQVRDAVGWESAVISQSVYFEVNRPQPKSANFWLFTGMVNGGNGSHVSANYQGRSSVGQSVDTAPIASPNYILRGGYQVASQALPLQVPEHDEFTFINGVFASGIVNDTMQSAQYRLASSIGQMGLPANQTTLSSAGYQLQPGFLAAVPARQSSPTPPPTPTPGPTPTPVPPQGCEFATLSINQGALFTNTPKVTLDLCGPNAAEMKVSNDGSFANAPWEPYRTSKGWTLTTLGQNVIARLVQARFKDRDGLTHHYAVDDIIYDPTAPSGAVAVNDPVPAALLGQLLAAEITQAAAGQATAAMESFTVGDMTYLRRLGKRAFDTPVPLLSTVKAEGVAVYLIAQDDNSGLAQMQLSENANGDGAAWQAYDGLVQWMPSGGDGEKQLYARFGDSAGNASGVYSATVVIDSQPPLGGINILEEIIGANTVNLQLYLAAEDNLSSIPAIRLSHDPAFADAPWQPFAAEMKWPIQVSANENEKTIYVQFRDAAGNISQTYSDTVLIDRQPPVMYVEVAAGDSLARQVNLYAYDELSALTSMRLSNDPMLIDAVVTLSYSDTVAWTFDERRVVWVQVDDSAGNRSDPYPAYAALPGDIPNPPVEQRVYLPLINR